MPTTCWPTFSTGGTSRVTWWRPTGTARVCVSLSDFIEHPNPPRISHVDGDVEPDLLLDDLEVDHDLKRVLAKQRGARWRR